MIELTDIVIRPATRQDAFPVTKLLRKVGLIQPEDGDIDEHWDRLWTNNPSYKDFAGEQNYGWAMEYNKQIVGYLGCFPRTYYLNQKPIQVCVSSQWGVEKDFRRFTLLLCEKFFTDQPELPKLNTTAQDASGLIFEKYGDGRRVPNDKLKDVYMIPFHLQPIINYRFRRNPFLGSLLGFVSGLIPVNLKFKFVKKHPNLQQVDIQKLPAAFETFWENYLKKSSGFIASRNKDVISWYYNSGFRKLDKRVYVYYESNQICGYASLVEEPVSGSTMKRYKIVDILATDNTFKSKMLKALIKEAYASNADLVEVHIPGMIDKEEIPAYTIMRVAPNWPCYYQTGDKALDEKLQISANWNISSYDGDSCLF